MKVEVGDWVKLRGMRRIYEVFANVAVGRILDVGEFVAEIKVNCVGCGVAMRFKGVPAGMSYDRPTCTIDGVELLAPCEPAYQKALQARAVFEIKKVPTRQ